VGTGEADKMPKPSEWLIEEQKGAPGRKHRHQM